MPGASRRLVSGAAVVPTSPPTSAWPRRQPWPPCGFSDDDVQIRSKCSTTSTSRSSIVSWSFSSCPVILKSMTGFEACVSSCLCCFSIGIEIGNPSLNPGGHPDPVVILNGWTSDLRDPVLCFAHFGFDSNGSRRRSRRPRRRRRPPLDCSWRPRTCRAST